MLVNLVLNNFINDSRVQKTSLFYKKKYGTVLVVALHDGKLPEEGHSRIFLRALANLLKEINKLAIDLKP